jgi:protease-4
MLQLIRTVFRFFWRLLDGLRKVVHLVLMLLLLGLFVALVSPAPVIVRSSTALVISPSGDLVDQLTGTPLDRALEAAGGEQRETLVGDLVEAIDRAAEDSRIEALVLNLDEMGSAGVTKLNRVAEAVARFRESGKRIVASGGGYSQAQYLLASTADEIYLHPLGDVFFQGFGYYRLFFGEAVDSLLIDWHVFRAGEYKTLHDSATRSQMSEVEKQEARIFIDQLWQGYRERIAAARSTTPDAIQQFADGYLDRLRSADGDMALLAKQESLVDELLTFDEVEQRLAELVGEDTETGSYRQIDFRDYLHATRLAAGRSTEGEGDVGVIVASGMIVDGETPPGTVGSDSMIELIRQARDDDDIRAVVLRVDSGGGSQFASDLILSELKLLRDAGKPLIVSMGDIATSGGYLISLAAEEIWANPDSVTGSIGVVAALPVADRTLEKIGIRLDGIGTTRYSGDFSPLGGLSPEAQEIIQLSVDSSYRRFLAQVAEGRSMSVEDVEPVAGGRIWTGRDARRLGLVDKLGGLDAAIESAAARAGLEDEYTVRYLEQPIDFGDALAIRFLTGVSGLTQRFGFNVNGSPISALLRRLAPESVRLLELRDPRGIYYDCFCGIR